MLPPRVKASQLGLGLAPGQVVTAAGRWVVVSILLSHVGADGGRADCCDGDGDYEVMVIMRYSVMVLTWDTVGCSQRR